MTSLFQVKGLFKAYAGVPAVDDLSFEIEDGSIVGLVGPNGSGKSTTIDCLTRYQTADAGSWSLAGRELSTASRYRIAHAGVTRTFQAVCPCAASPSIASRRRRAWPAACPSCPRGAATSRT